jgi:DNA-binding response OmpR family regulator
VTFEAPAVVLIMSEDQLVRDEALLAFPSDTKVVLASDAREALKIGAEIKPTVLVVDLQSGSAGGFGFLKELRQSKRWDDVPAIMLLERRQDSWLAAAAGADASFVKPLDVDELARAVASLGPAPTD